MYRNFFPDKEDIPYFHRGGNPLRAIGSVICVVRLE